jgi:hypothetical protein
VGVFGPFGLRDVSDGRFIRDDEEPGEVSWEERLARAYESKLFKEFALVCVDLYPTSQGVVSRFGLTPDRPEALQVPSPSAPLAHS